MQILDMFHINLYQIKYIQNSHYHQVRKKYKKGVGSSRYSKKFHDFTYIHSRFYVPMRILATYFQNRLYFIIPSY